MRKFALALAAGTAMLAVGTLQAQSEPPQLPGQADVGRVEAGTYQLDPAHTLVGWRANHLGFNDYFGIFGNATGTLQIDPANPAAAKLDVTVPITSVVTVSEGLKDHLLRHGKDGGSPDFFGAEPAPARFVSTKVEPTGGTTANITGNLTMNGVTRPVVIAAEFTGAGDNPMSKVKTIGFEGRTAINRSEWNIGFGIPMVSDQVELDISAAFERR